MRRSVTVRRAADQASVELRLGDKTLGGVMRLASESDALMTGALAHRPAYADVAADLLRLARALAAAADDEIAAVRAELETAGLQVWHVAHDMRIDRPQTVAVIEGEVRFSPNDAFLMMRTGGLG